MRNLQRIRSLISTLETADRGKLTDLARTLTGIAYVDRILKQPGRDKRLKRCEATINKLVGMQLFTKHELSFRDVYKVVLEFPLYGKTRAINFTRGISAARLAMGVDPLVVDERAWQDILAMHENVAKALRLLGISDLEDVSEACIVLSALIKISYAEKKEKACCLPLDGGDLALIACEYSCALKETGKYYSGSDLEKCKWLLGKLPDSIEGVKMLRRRITAHCRRSANYSNGYDDDRARNNVKWWLGDPSIQTTKTCRWPVDQAASFYCAACEDVKALSRCTDTRASYCSLDCQVEQRNAKRQKKC